jgi:hypothetical protein
MLSKLGIVGLLLLFQQPQAVTPPRFRLFVTDSTGAVIPGAHILLHRAIDPQSHYGTAPIEPRQEPDRVLTADKAGQVDLTMRSGAYNVCVMADYFEPTCKEFDFYKDSVDLTIPLGITKLESRHLMP